MPTFIKTGFWDKLINNNPQQAKAPKGWLNLDLLISQNIPPIPPSSIATLGSSLYSTNPSTSGFGTNNGIFLGADAGFNAPNSDYAIFIGNGAGSTSVYAVRSNFIGNSAGYQATAEDSNFIGRQAGINANALNSNFFGTQAGSNVTNTQNSNFLGKEAGKNAGNSNNSNFLGQNAGSGAVAANNCNFLGQEAGMNSLGGNVNAFGYQAHKGGTLSGQTVFVNATLPSFVDRAAATTAITVANGAVAGNTYLYYNQTTFAIEGVRL